MQPRRQPRLVRNPAASSNDYIDSSLNNKNNNNNLDQQQQYFSPYKYTTSATANQENINVDVGSDINNYAPGFIPDDDTSKDMNTSAIKNQHDEDDDDENDRLKIRHHNNSRATKNNAGTDGDANNGTAPPSPLILQKGQGASQPSLNTNNNTGTRRSLSNTNDGRTPFRNSNTATACGGSFLYNHSTNSRDESPPPNFGGTRGRTGYGGHFSNTSNHAAASGSGGTPKSFLPSPTNIIHTTQKTKNNQLASSPSVENASSSTHSSPSKAVTAFELAMRFAAASINSHPSTEDDDFYGESLTHGGNISIRDNHHDHENHNSNNNNNNGNRLNDVIDDKELTYGSVAVAPASLSSHQQQQQQGKKVVVVKTVKKKRNKKKKNNATLNLSQTSPSGVFDDKTDDPGLTSRTLSAHAFGNEEDTDGDDNEEEIEEEEDENENENENGTIDQNEQTTMFDMVNHLAEVGKRTSSKSLNQRKRKNQLVTPSTSNNNDGSNKKLKHQTVLMKHNSGNSTASNNNMIFNNNNSFTGSNNPSFASALPSFLRNANSFDRLYSHRINQQQQQRQQQRRGSNSNVNSGVLTPQTVFSSQESYLPFSLSDGYNNSDNTDILSMMTPPTGLIENNINNNNNTDRTVLYHNHRDEIELEEGEGIAEAILRHERHKNFKLVDRAKAIARRLLKEADREITVMISKTASEAVKIEAAKKALEIIEETANNNNNNNNTVSTSSSSDKNSYNTLTQRSIAETLFNTIQEQKMTQKKMLEDLERNNFDEDYSSSTGGGLFSGVLASNYYNNNMSTNNNFSTNNVLSQGGVEGRTDDNHHHHQDPEDPEYIKRREIELKAEEDLENEMNQKLQELDKKLKVRTKAINAAASSLDSYRHAQQEKPQEMFEMSQATKRHKERKKRMMDGRRKSRRMSGAFGLSLLGGERNNNNNNNNNNFDDGSGPEGSGNLDYDISLSEGYQFCKNLVEDELTGYMLDDALDALFAEEERRALEQLDNLNNSEAERRESLRRQNAKRMEAQRNAAEAAWLMSSGDPKLTAIRQAAMQRRQEEDRRAKEQLEQELRDAENKFHSVRMKVDDTYRVQCDREESLKQMPPKALADLKAEMELLEQEEKLQKQKEEAEQKRLEEIERQKQEVEDAEREAQELEDRINRISAGGGGTNNNLVTASSTLGSPARAESQQQQQLRGFTAFGVDNNNNDNNSSTLQFNSSNYNLFSSGSTSALSPGSNRQNSRSSYLHHFPPHLHGHRNSSPGRSSSPTRSSNQNLKNNSLAMTHNTVSNFGSTLLPTHTLSGGSQQQRSSPPRTPLLPGTHHRHHQSSSTSFSRAAQEQHSSSENVAATNSKNPFLFVSEKVNETNQRFQPPALTNQHRREHSRGLSTGTTSSSLGHHQDSREPSVNPPFQQEDSNNNNNKNNNINRKTSRTSVSSYHSRLGVSSDLN